MANGAPPHIYRNFTLRVGPISPKSTAPRRYRVSIYGLVPGGQPRSDEHETQVYDPAIFVIESEGRRVDLLDAMKSRRITAPQLYRLGSILSDLLLIGSIRKRWLESLRVARERKERLRLRLIIEASELVPLPWEYLYLQPPGASDDNDLYFLALQPDISIVRHEAIDEPEPRLEPRERYRLVAALAAPGDQPQLKLDEDRRAIERMIQTVTFVGRVEPTWVEMATRKSLRDALRQPADMFHFAGHGYFDGKMGQIILDRGDGQASDFYSARLLAGLLREAGVKLAILSACETAQRSDKSIWDGVAPALVKAGVAAVVASQYRLQDRNAPPLAEELYRSVLAGETVDEAVYYARRAIYQQAGLENRDWGAPVLYLRTEDGVLFPRRPQPVDRTTPRLSPTPLQTPLVGRDDELAQAQASLRDQGKTYFFGAYGVGKTSLVTELFNRVVEERPFADGTLWCRATGMDAEQVLEWVAAHFPGQRVAQAVGQTEKINALRELLAERGDLLIGLDEVDARAARALLEAAGNCTVVLNGPRRVNLAGLVQEFELAALSPDEAEQLFLSLANRSAGMLQDRERELVQRICARMRRLPLAIKLAALKHAEGESLETLWEALQVAPAIIVPEHEEVSVIFETVWNDLQLAPVALRLLIRIASFPALEAPLAPLRSGERSLDFFQAKEKLMALGLISAVGADRLAVHPLLGLLAQQKADPQALEAERKRAADWLLEYAHQHREDYNALEQEHANLLGLLDGFESERRWDKMVGLMRDLFNYLRVRGQWQQAFQRLETILSAVEELSASWQRGWVYLHRGIMHLLRADYSAAEADFDQADRLFAQENDQVYRGKVLYRRGTLSAMTGQLHQAREQLQRALAWMGEAAPAHDRAGAHQRLADVLATQGDLDEAEEHYDRALALGDPEEQARAHIALGNLMRQRGEHDQARQHFELALTLTAQLGHVLFRASLEQELGYVHYYQGRYDEALRHFGSAQALFKQLKYQPGLAQTLHALGNVALARDSLDEARQHYQAALAVNQAIRHAASVAYNQYQLGVVAHRQGQRDAAANAYQAVLATAEEIGDISLQAAALFQLGNLAAEAGERSRAFAFLDRALALADQVHDRLTTASALYYRGVLQAQEGHLESARDTLAEAHAAFAALKAVHADTVGRVLRGIEAIPPGTSIADLLGPDGRIDVIERGMPHAAAMAGRDTHRVDVVLEGSEFIGSEMEEE